VQQINPDNRMATVEHIKLTVLAESTPAAGAEAIEKLKNLLLDPKCREITQQIYDTIAFCQGFDFEKFQRHTTKELPE
jgi:hypothetical protein